MKEKSSPYDPNTISKAKLSALTIGSDAKLHIQNQIMCGRIHSIFHDAINIILEDGFLLSILESKKGYIPFGLLVEREAGSFRLFGLEVGKRVTFTNGYIYADNIVLVNNLADAKVWFQPEFPVDGGRVDLSLDEVINILFDNLFSIGIRKGGLGVLLQGFHSFYAEDEFPISSDDPFLLSLGASIKNLIEPLKQEHISSSREGLLKLIGTGFGLTPSGDDFMLGLYSALYFLHPDARLSKHFIETLAMEMSGKIAGKTSKVSEVYLEYAIRGKVHSFLFDFLLSIHSGMGNLIDLHAKRVISIGSSSGTDILCGCLFALIILSKKKTTNR